MDVKTFATKFNLNWEEDKKGAIWGDCTLPEAALITEFAALVAEHKGRIMTITPYWEGEGEDKVLKAAYHFDVQGATITCTITLVERQVPSITPILKSADWNEREMQELYDVQVVGHPNPKRLFLDDSINLDDNTMVPLSMAMSGASTQTLWERVMASSNKEVKGDE